MWKVLVLAYNFLLKLAVQLVKFQNFHGNFLHMQENFTDGRNVSSHFSFVPTSVGSMFPALWKV